MPNHFRDSWLKEAEFKDWLCSDGLNARCSICHDTINISSMGRSALTSHAKSRKHRTLAENAKKSFGIGKFFQPSTSGAAASTSSSNSQEGGKQTNLTDFSHFSSRDCLKAETLWALFCVENHISYSANENTSKIFRRMFPASGVAEGYRCGPNKLSYLVNFGLAPYFSDRLLSSVGENEFVLLFDESLNRATHKKQMDLHVRYWDVTKENSGDIVTTTYITSEFLGHGQADVLLEHFLSGTDRFDHANLIQVSMDGPSVNWRFYNLLKAHRAEEGQPKLIDTGSCGLHTIHGAFEDGISKTEWAIDKLFSSAYWLLNAESPARLEDYTQVTGSTEFPLRFCKHRWVENVRVASRFLSILPNIREYRRAVENKDINKPSCKSYTTVKEWLDDKLIVVKVQVFLSIAREVEPYLKLYQTDRPMVPFMRSDLTRLMKNVLTRIVKPEQLNSTDIMKTALNEESLLPPHKVDLGFAAEKEMKSLLHKKKISDKDSLALRASVKAGLVKMAEKLQEKSPLKYKVVQAAACFDPKEIASSKETSLEDFNSLIICLEKNGQLSEIDCDYAKAQYRQLQDDVASSQVEKFQQFDRSKNRLDDFFFELIGSNAEFKVLFKVVKSIMILSHGQATVERGFSVNKEICQTNMAEISVISQRIVYEHVRGGGGSTVMPIPQQLLAAASGAYAKYKMYLDDKKRESEKAESTKKRKSIESEISELKIKKSRIETSARELRKSADDYCTQAEHAKSINAVRVNVAKSNSHRKGAKEKDEEAKKIEKEIEQKLAALRESL